MDFVLKQKNKDQHKNIKITKCCVIKKDQKLNQVYEH